MKVFLYTLKSMIKAVIGTLTCTSMASNNMSDITGKNTVATLIVRGIM